MSPSLSTSANLNPQPGEPLLVVDGLAKQFDGFQALDEVSFQVHPGEILGLVGPNGSGKTTCINVITGLYAPDSGTVRFQGISTGGWPPHRLVHAGINRTFQIPKPFHSLTVLENVQIAAAYGQRGTSNAEVAGILKLLELADQANRKAAELNSVHLKMLDLARALATKPVLLCLDELAAGFNPGELSHVVEQVQSIAHTGVAIIVVEHLMGFIDDVTDRVLVLNAGYGQVQVLWGGGPDRVDSAQTVVLLGVNGAGKTTLIKTIMGLIRQTRGTITLNGVDLSHTRTDKRVRAGISYMSEMGCFPGLSIDENIRIGGQFMPPEALRQRMGELYEIFPAIAPRKKALASSLSGGQRKMVGIAKALAGNPKLLIMDEPSAGLSPLLVQEVIDILGRFRKEGIALLIAEQNVRFLTLADHVVTMSGGRMGFSGTVQAMHSDDMLRKAYFDIKGKDSG